MKTTNNFYKEIFFLCVLSIVAVFCQAQRLRLNTYGSYVLEGTYHIYYPDGDSYKGTITQGLQLGLGAEYLVTPSYGVELNYLKRYAGIYPEGTVNPDRRNGSLRFEYVLLGINAYPQRGLSKLEAYGGVSAGAVIQTSCVMLNSAGHPEENVITKFAWAARLGGIFWLSNQVGLKLQTQWLSSLQFENAAVNFDVHRLDGAQAQSSIANQFEIGSGVIIKLGKLAGEN